MSIDEYGHQSVRNSESHTDPSHLSELIRSKQPFILFREPGKSESLAYAQTDAAKSEIIVKGWNGNASYFGSKASILSTIEEPPLPEETSRDAYEKAFKTIKGEFQTSGLKKVILSRIIRAKLPENTDLVGITRALEEKYPNAFVYLVRDPRRGTWIGASPETLLYLNNGKGYTEALAGTIPITAENQSWSNKEKEEQSMVSSFIENKLKSSQISYSKEGPFTIKAGPVMHLKTRFNMQTNKGPEIVNYLHPTPAIAGVPRNLALACINAVEGHSRSLYCGYLGKMNNPGNCNLFVNLRCLQVVNDEVALYVGGGITAESDLESEWNETEIKANTLFNVIPSLRQ